MRLSDAGMRQRKTKLIYPNHRPPPWSTEAATRDRSSRMLEVRVMPPTKTYLPVRAVLFLETENRYPSLSSIDPKPTPIKASRELNISTLPSPRSREAKGLKARGVSGLPFIGTTASVRCGHL
jgi:hypothetical protein